MKTLIVAATIAVAPSATLAAGCQEAFTALLDILVDDGAIEEAPTALVRARSDNWCGVRALRVPLESGEVLAIEDFAWRGTDIARFVDAGLPPTALELEAKGVRFARTSGDAAINETLSDLMSGDGMDVSFSGEWEQAARQLVVHQARLRKGADDMVSVSARIDNVDLTSDATIQMSMGAGSLAAMQVSLSVADAFVPYVESAGDISPAFLDEVMAGFPEETLPEASQRALRRFAEDGPLGNLEFGFEAANGFGPARFLPYVIGGASAAPAAIWDGVVFDVSYVPR